MAFNPFESFRKNQRSLMAFAAIVCMIVFVFSFGQGDFFQTLQEWLATRTRPGTQVTTLYGEPVFEAQLDKIARQRDLANTFMVRTTALGVNMAMTELEKQQKILKKAWKTLLAGSCKVGACAGIHSLRNKCVFPGLAGHERSKRFKFSFRTILCN